MLDRLDRGHVVALVVSGAAGPHLAVTHRGLERRRFPLFEGIDGLDVVVAVDREVGLAGVLVPVSYHNRVAAVHIHDLRLHAHRLEAVT